MNTEPLAVAITVDDREHSPEVAAELRRRAPGLLLSIRRLDVGDFEVGERLVVERKTVSDFAASVVDGRLFRQAAGLAWGTRRGVLILEGTGDLPVGVSRESMQGALITVGVFFGIPVLRSRNGEETARILIYLARQDRRFARNSLARGARRLRGKRARQNFVLQGLPGVGPRRAEALLERFGSVKNVTAADVALLAEVPGIGETIAAKIRWVLDEPAPWICAERKPGENPKS